jgi:hypothetical protein
MGFVSRPLSLRFNLRFRGQGSHVLNGENAIGVYQYVEASYECEKYHVTKLVEAWVRYGHKVWYVKANRKIR